MVRKENEYMKALREREIEDLAQNAVMVPHVEALRKENQGLREMLQRGGETEDAKLQRDRERFSASARIGGLRTERDMLREEM